MKVTLQKDYKQYYTFLDLERAKEVIKAEKDDESTAASWAVYAVNEVLSYYNRTKNAGYAYADESDIIKADARTARNCRAWNEYGETQDMDVWIEAKAFTYNCFIEVGAYLSDIWQMGGENSQVHHIYYRVFEEKHHSW